MADINGDTIKITVKADTDTAQKNIDKLTERLTELQKVASKTVEYSAVTKLNTLAKVLEKISVTKVNIPKDFSDRIRDIATSAASFTKLDFSKFGDLTEEFSRLGRVNLRGVNIPKDLPNRVRELGIAAGSLQNLDFSKFEEFAEAFSKLASVGTVKMPGFAKVKKTADEASKSTQALTGAVKENSKETEINGRATEDAAKRISKKAITEAYNRQQTLDSAEATKRSNSAIRGANSSYKEFVKTLKKAGGLVGKFAFNISTLPFRKVGNAISGTLKPLGNFISSLKRIALYRAIRTIVKEITQALNEGMQNLYQYSKLIDGQFAKSMDMLATSALYVKNSLGAMVAPIINQLAPAVDRLTDSFVALLNKINETIASLTGASTWTRAIKYPVEYAEATDDATKAAKKFKATILGFDELNVLNDNSDNSRGKGSDALDYSKMFTEEVVDTNTTDWVKKVKESWENADFTDIGRSIGLKLQSGLRSIPWDMLNSEGDRFAKSFGTLINGFVTTEDLGKDIGNSIAQAINLGVGVVHTFLDTVEWRKVGEFIGDGISGLINGVDAFLLGQTIGGALKGVINLAIGTLTQIDFVGFGNQVGKFLKGIDWEGVFSGLDKLIWEAFKACIDGIAGLIEENPLAGAILVAVLGLKARSAVAGLMGSAFGFGGLAQTGAAGAADAAGGIFSAPITFNAAQVTLMAATAYVGWKIGKSIYDSNLFGIGDLADDAVEAVGNAVDLGKDVAKNGTKNLNEKMPEAISKILKLIPGVRNIIKQREKAMEDEAKGVGRNWSDRVKNPLLTNDIKNIGGGLSFLNFNVLADGKKQLKDIETAVDRINNKDVRLGFRTSGTENIIEMSDVIADMTDKTVKVTANTIGTQPVADLGANILDLKSKTVTETAKVVGANDVSSLVTNVNKLGNKTVNLVMNVTKSADFEKNLKTVTDTVAQAVIAIMPSGGVGGGSLSLLKGFANGGTPDRGSLFLANERGPELVANIGNRTQVANNAQIVDGISAGVEMANEQQNALLREQNNLLRQLVAKEFTAEISTDSLINGIRRQNRRDGQATIAVG